MHKHAWPCRQAMLAAKEMKIVHFRFFKTPNGLLLVEMASKGGCKRQESGFLWRMHWLSLSKGSPFFWGQGLIVGAIAGAGHAGFSRRVVAPIPRVVEDRHLFKLAREGIYCISALFT